MNTEVVSASRRVQNLPRRGGFLRIAGLCALLAAGTPALAQTAEPLPDISLEDLINTEIVTVSRKAQSLQQVAAAVFLISQDDIARSGARNLGDILAMAPGLDVARLGNNRWAVSARGYNGRFANKLQVLKDGRSIYSPPFSSVTWEAEDTVLEDIERIEIIRGPDAAMWGANAVNGTINIITRKARETQGGLIAAGTGSEDRHNLTARYGMPLGDAGYLRVYGKSVDRRAGFTAGDARASDHGESGMAGFRADWLLSSGNRLTVSGEAYRTRNGETYNVPWPLTAGYIAPMPSVTELTGGHLQGRYESLHDDGAEVIFQSYLTHRVLEADLLMREERTTVDLDMQYRFAPRGNHDLMVGANLRTSVDTIDVVAPAAAFTFARRSRDFRLAGLFFNDEIDLVPKRFRVTVGARLEHNNYAGSDLQPTLRFLWTPNARQTVWGAISRAARTPSRAELDISMPLTVLAPTPQTFGMATLVTLEANRDATQKSEKLDALEFGYRHRVSTGLSFDAAFFVHRDRDVLTVVPGTPFVGPGYLVQPLTNIKGGRSRIQGFELSAFAQPSANWRLKPAYTYMHGTADGVGDAFSEALASSDMNKIPRHQFSLRSQHDIGRGQQLDFWLTHKSRMRMEATGTPVEIPARSDLDIRYAWKPSRDLQISLVGQNLLHRRTLEYIPDQLPSAPVNTGRGFHLRIEHRF